MFTSRLLGFRRHILLRVGSSRALCDCKIWPSLTPTASKGGFWIDGWFIKAAHEKVLGDLVKTSPSREGGVHLVSCREARIPHAFPPQNQDMKQKQYCNKFNKDLKEKKKDSGGFEQAGVLRFFAENRREKQWARILLAGDSWIWKFNDNF